MQHIKHLYWRAGFGLSPSAWQKRKNWTVPQAVDHLFQEAEQSPSITRAMAASSIHTAASMEEEMSKAERIKQLQQKAVAGTTDWIQLMADESSSSLKHRMMLFWHGHFACRIKQWDLAMQQLQTLEQHALGNFRDLVLAIARDPAMIRYLNNQQNKKQKPNENFARELMELFTIGRGNYTEQDVKEAARAFTGWSSDLAGKFVFRRFFHDFDNKVFMGKSGNFDGGDIIDMILQRRETAIYITRKIYRHFVNEVVDEAQVNSLATGFYQSGYDIGQLMRAIFSSNWFYEPHNQGNQIKSPVVLLVGMLRSLPTVFEDPRNIFVIQKALGQLLFDPPNVAGWPGGKSWIDNSTLLLRLNLPVYLLQSGDADLRPKDEPESEIRAKRVKWLQAEVDFAEMEAWLGRFTPIQAARELAAYFIVRPVKLPTLLESELSKQSDAVKVLPMLLVGVMSLPEYQLC